MIGRQLLLARCGGVAAAALAVGLAPGAADLVHADANIPPASLPAARPGYKLLQAQCVFRHGARLPMIVNHPVLTPVDDWDPPPPQPNVNVALADVRTLNPPTGPLLDVHWSSGVERPLKNGAQRGSLTAVGIGQVQALGQSLRRRYVDELALVPPSFDSEAVYLRSTYTPRTLGSMKALLSGMYPELAENGRPVTVMTSHKEFETLTPSLKACPRLRELREEGFRDYSACRDTDDARVTLSAVLGMERKGFNPMLVHDIMASRLAHDKPLYPIDAEWDWILPAVQFRAVQIFLVWAVANNPVGRSLGIGRCLDELLRRIDAVVGGISSPSSFADAYYFPTDTVDRPLLLYAAHDTTLVLLLTSLGVFDYKWPKYAAAVTFELWKRDDGQLAVQVLYDGDPVVLPAASNKSTMCPLEDFRNHLRKVIPRDFLVQCQPGPTGGTRPPPPPPPPPPSPPSRPASHFNPVGGPD